MKRLLIFAIASASMMLAGCGGNQTSEPALSRAPLGSARGLALMYAAGRTPALRTTPARSWVSPELKATHHGRAALIYVPDGSEVDLYTYKSGKQLGAAGGFYGASYSCSDKKGDVYVVDGQTIALFAARTLTVTRTLTDSNELPVGCAVNPVNNDLAVTTFDGGVSIFPNGTGSPVQYVGTEYTWPAGYDPKGNLFAEGEQGNCSGICLEELPHGGSSWQILSFDQAIGFPNAVQWDGKYLGVGDQQSGGKYVTAIYQTSVSGTTATSHNTVTLSDSCFEDYSDVVGWAGYSKKPNDVPGKPVTQLVGTNLWCSAMEKWAYPKGGSPAAQPRYQGGVPVIVK
jgi:hypothetical protein